MKKPYAELKVSYLSDIQYFLDSRSCHALTLNLSQPKDSWSSLVVTVYLTVDRSIYAEIINIIIEGV